MERSVKLLGLVKGFEPVTSRMRVRHAILSKVTRCLYSKQSVELEYGDDDTTL